MEKKLNEMRKKAGHSTLKVSPVYQGECQLCSKLTVDTNTGQMFAICCISFIILS